MQSDTLCGVTSNEPGTFTIPAIAVRYAGICRCYGLIVAGRRFADYHGDVDAPEKKEEVSEDFSGEGTSLDQDLPTTTTTMLAMKWFVGFFRGFSKKEPGNWL